MVRLADAKDLPVAKLGDSDKLATGDWMIAIGNPFELETTVSAGIISGKGRELGGIRRAQFLQTDAAINPGNSGGPLINLEGEVVGINTAIASNSGGNEGIGFSIPSNLVRRVTEQLLEHGKVTRAYLGVKLDPDFNSEAAARLKLDRIRGARVLDVYPGTPASRARLQKDDVVFKFDGVEVIDENHLINLISALPPGQKVKLTIWRDRGPQGVDVVVGEYPTPKQRLR